MPGGNVCSVATCKSNSSRAKKRGESVVFFNFPKNPEVKKEWIKNCHRNDQFNAEHKRICSKHFRTEDYEDGIQARVMGTYPKKLKKNAIPLLYLLSTEEETIFSEKTKKALQEEREALIENILNKSLARKVEPDCLGPNIIESSVMIKEEILFLEDHDGIDIKEENKNS